MSEFQGFDWRGKKLLTIGDGFRLGIGLVLAQAVIAIILSIVTGIMLIILTVGGCGILATLSELMKQ